MELTYYELYKMNKLEARKKLIQMYFQLKSFSAVALMFQTTRNTVRKFVVF